MTEIIVSTEKAKPHIDYIHGFLKSSYRAEGISRKMVVKSIEQWNNTKWPRTDDRLEAFSNISL